VWIADYVSQNSQLPISQVQGFTQFVAKQDVVATQNSTTSTSFVALSAAGPTLDNLQRGTYILQYGAAIQPVANAQPGGLIVPYINTVYAGDDYRIWGSGDASTALLGNSVARSAVIDLTENSNSVTLKYASWNGGQTFFENRWLMALRIANL
jgi:hypothetical protein